MSEKRSVSDQVISGLRLSGWVVLTCVTGILLVRGTLVVSHQAAGSVAMGWATLAIGFVILVLNLDGWAKVLPGLLALAAFNALVMAASGHVLNDLSTPVSRSMAIGSAIALAIASAVSIHFYGKRLSLLDRVILVAYVGFILLGFASRWVLVSFGLGTLVLAVPWLYTLVRRECPRT